MHVGYGYDCEEVEEVCGDYCDGAVDEGVHDEEVVGIVAVLITCLLTVEEEIAGWPSVPIIQCLCVNSVNVHH